jgi:hypothetical protein
MRALLGSLMTLARARNAPLAMFPATSRIHQFEFGIRGLVTHRIDDNLQKIEALALHAGKTDLSSTLLLTRNDTCMRMLTWATQSRRRSSRLRSHETSKLGKK